MLGTGLLLLAGARLLPLLPVPLPVCGLRALTGLPCPLCGSTRCILAWSHFDAVQAFRCNPLVAAACVAFGAWSVVSLLDASSGRKWAGSVMARLQRKPWPAVLLATALVNWLYLCLSLPK
jgi:hypothetical protein